MNERIVLDPAVRDLLVAIDTAVDAAGLSDYSLAAVHTTLRNVALYGLEARDAAWLAAEVGELSDAKRVRFADRWDLYQATKEQPA
jgi:hypothetical protein